MKVYTCKCFRGFNPVGVAAVIVAESKFAAAKLLEKELDECGLPQPILASWMHEVGTSLEGVFILADGEY